MTADSGEREENMKKKHRTGAAILVMTLLFFSIFSGISVPAAEMASHAVSASVTESEIETQAVSGSAESEVPDVGAGSETEKAGSEAAGDRETENKETDSSQSEETEGAGKTDEKAAQTDSESEVQKTVKKAPVSAETAEIHYISRIDDKGAVALDHDSDADVAESFVPDLAGPDPDNPNESNDGGLFYDLRKDNTDGDPGLAVLADARYHFVAAYLVKDGDFAGRVNIAPELGVKGIVNEITGEREAVYQYSIVDHIGQYTYDPAHMDIYVLYRKYSYGGRIHYGIRDKNGTFHELKLYEDVPSMAWDQFGVEDNLYDGSRLKVGSFTEWETDDSGNYLKDADGGRIMQNRYAFDSAYVVRKDGSKTDLDDSRSLAYRIENPYTERWTFNNAADEPETFGRDDELYVCLTKTGIVHYGYLDQGIFTDFPNTAQVLEMPDASAADEYAQAGMNLVHGDITVDGYVYTYTGEALLARDYGKYESGTAISSVLRLLADGHIYDWQYTDAKGQPQTFLHDDQIYLVFEKRSADPAEDPVQQLGTPRHEKWLTANQTAGQGADGTYTLHLSVSGNTVVKNLPKGDLVILVDVSSSMLDGDRIPNEMGALYKLSEKLFDGETDMTVHLIPYATVARASVNVTSKEQMDNWIDHLDDKGFIASGNGGATNWQDAIRAAREELSTAAPDSIKSVIFISDGNPTVRNSKEPFQGFNAPLKEKNAQAAIQAEYPGIWGSGWEWYQVFDFSPRRRTKNVQDCYEAAREDGYSLVHETGVSLYSVAVYEKYELTMQKMLNYAYTRSENESNGSVTVPQDHYWFGDDQDSISRAFLSIAEDIKQKYQRYSICDVKIQDRLSYLTSCLYDITGITEDPAVPQLQTAIRDSCRPDFCYYYAVRQPEQKDLKEDQLDWQPWTPAEGVTIPEASYDVTTRTIDWDLSKAADTRIGIQNGEIPKNVSLKVTCTVWPNQRAFDRVNDIRNKKDVYRPLSDRNLKPSGDDYEAYSNKGGSAADRSGSLTYTIREHSSGKNLGTSSLEYERPSMTVLPAVIRIYKQWIDKNGAAIGSDSPLAASLPQKLHVTVKEDEHNYVDVQLTAGGNWEAELPVSPGLYSGFVRERVKEVYGLTLGFANGPGALLNPGHSYTAQEEQKAGFVLVSRTAGNPDPEQEEEGVIRPLVWHTEAGYMWDAVSKNPKKCQELAWTFINRSDDLELPSTGGGTWERISLLGMGLMAAAALALLLHSRTKMLFDSN